MQHFKAQRMNVLNIVISNNRKFINSDGCFTRGPLSRERLWSQTEVEIIVNLNWLEGVLSVCELETNNLQYISLWFPVIEPILNALICLDDKADVVCQDLYIC